MLCVKWFEALPFGFGALQYLRRRANLKFPSRAVVCPSGDTVYNDIFEGLISPT
jgi:hypothetical protein